MKLIPPEYLKDAIKLSVVFPDDKHKAQEDDDALAELVTILCQCDNHAEARRLINSLRAEARTNIREVRGL